MFQNEPLKINDKEYISFQNGLCIAMEARTCRVHSEEYQRFLTNSQLYSSCIREESASTIVQPRSLP